MADVSGLTVVAEQGSTGEGKLLGTIEDDETVEVSAEEYFKDSNYVAVDSMAKALMEVKAGTADVALVDSVCALATEQDDIMFYFSGHGFPGMLVTYDGITSGENITYAYLRERLGGCKARNKFCFVDACYSGSTADEYTKGGPSATDGIFYFMSSSKGETSGESTLYDNGFFTQALVAGLKGMADGDHNRELTVHELFTYCYKRVTKMSTRYIKDDQGNVTDSIVKQHPQLVGPLSRTNSTNIFTWPKSAGRTQPKPKP